MSFWKKCLNPTTSLNDLLVLVFFFLAISLFGIFICKSNRKLPKQAIKSPINTAAEADKAVDYLMSQNILGIDTETRPSFKKGQSHSVALLQVSTHDTCFLFRLNLTGITPAIIRLLEDSSIPKIGLSLRDDINSLHKRAAFHPGNFIDLQKHVCELGVEDLSLQKLYANFFHQKISKSVRLSNWESDVLSDRQKLYAATDAWACINIYEELCRLEKTGDYELVKTDENKETDV